MWFDPHWHARDWDESHKETVAHSLLAAYWGGATAIAAMPNTRPALTTLALCRDYLALGYALQELGVKFYAHIGLTPDTEQVKRAVEACRQEKDIIGMKAYFGRSTGNLAIPHEEQQLSVLETLAAEGYDGVLVAHCEKEELMSDSLYHPATPQSWSLCRPERAEIESFIDLLGMAEAVGFTGKLHIAHVSTTPVIDAIHAYKGPVRISCGLTPHHFLLDYTSVHNAWYKCNPPLRSPTTRQELWKRLQEGKITLIESDHAPHGAVDKMNADTMLNPAPNSLQKGMNPPEKAIIPASGIANGWVWPYLLLYLKERGFSEAKIRELTFSHAVSLYGLQFEQRHTPADFHHLAAIRKDYPYDVFQEVFPCWEKQCMLSS